MTIEKIIEFIAKWEAESERLAAEGRSAYRGDSQLGEQLLQKSDGIDAVIDDLRKLVKPLPEAMELCEWVPVSEAGEIGYCNMFLAYGRQWRAGSDAGKEGVYTDESFIPFTDITHVARPVREGGG